MNRVVASVLVAVAAATAAVRGGAGVADLGFRGDVPADVRALATTTWERFATAVRGHPECLLPTTLEATWELADRGEYRPGEGAVVLRIPGTAPNLAATMVHEFAHHLEFTCAAQRDLRAAFLAAQGIPRGTPWFEGTTWDDTPSEQFAEATVRLVLGERPAHSTVRLSAAALEVVRSWASGVRRLDVTHRP